jgi:hypothetical protein
VTDWEVGVITESNYIKKVRVNDCVTRTDAEASALGMTGAKRVIYSTPKTYNDDVEPKNSSGFDSGSNISFSGLLWLIGICLVIAYWQYVLAFAIICGIVWFLMRRNG